MVPAACVPPHAACPEMQKLDSQWPGPCMSWQCSPGDAQPPSRGLAALRVAPLSLPELAVLAWGRLAVLGMATQRVAPAGLTVARSLHELAMRAWGRELAVLAMLAEVLRHRRELQLPRREP